MNRLALAVLLLAACGDNDDNNPGPDAPPAEWTPPER